MCKTFRKSHVNVFLKLLDEMHGLWMLMIVIFEIKYEG